MVPGRRPRAADGSEATKVAKIGVIAPLSGDLSALGLGIQNSVDLAIKQANEANAIPGWTLELDAAGRPGQARRRQERRHQAGRRRRGRRRRRHPELLGVPVGAAGARRRRNIVQVSPANTDPTLTQGPDPANPKRAVPELLPHLHHRRRPGPVRGEVPATTPGIKKVATIHDKKTYGQGLVAAFTEAFKAGGGEIVAAETINPDDKDFSAVISKVKGANPEAVYYGGEYPQAGPLSQQMKAAGLNVPLMGGDGIFDPAYIELAGKTSEGDLATSVGAPTETPGLGQAVRRGLQRRPGYKEPYAAYGALLLRRGQRDHQRAEGLAGQDAEDAKSARAGDHRRDAARSPSTARPARSPSTSSATPPPRC